MKNIKHYLSFLSLIFTILALYACSSDSDSDSDGKKINESIEDYVGTWLIKGENENEILLFVFFEDGSYIHAEYDEQQAGGEPDGMEYGTVDADDNGIVTVNIAFDNNDTTGLNDFVGNNNLKGIVEGNTLTLEIVAGIDEGDTLEFTQMTSSGNVGTFNNTENKNELLTFVFFPDGETYCHFEYVPGDEESGMECYKYTIAADDVMTIGEKLLDNNSGMGLTDFIQPTDNELSISFDAEGMTLDFVDTEGPGSITFDRL